MLLTRRSALALASAAVLGTAATLAPTVSSATPAGSHAAATTSTVASAKTGGYSSEVFGTWRNGTVRGKFHPIRSFAKQGQAYVQGTMNAKVLRSNGTLLGKTTRHEVTLPIMARGAHTGTAAQPQAQAQATCQILHLNLGPLNLNLLGLHVHLNRVVLNITAIPGPGNLLGNLLCAVAHLLDNTNPSLLNVLQLTSVLNRVLGVLGLG